jgi:hypothetical protein
MEMVLALHVPMHFFPSFPEVENILSESLAEILPSGVLAFNHRGEKRPSLGWLAIRIVMLLHYFLNFVAQDLQQSGDCPPEPILRVWRHFRCIELTDR